MSEKTSLRIQAPPASFTPAKADSRLSQMMRLVREGHSFEAVARRLGYANAKTVSTIFGTLGGEVDPKRSRQVRNYKRNRIALIRRVAKRMEAEGALNVGLRNPIIDGFEASE